MKLKEKDIVILISDHSEQGVASGSEGVVVEVLDKPREGYLVEFFDEDDYPTEVLALPPEEIELRVEAKDVSTMTV